MAGLLGGLLGVGGGVILIPLLVGLLKLSQHEAHVTSLAVIIPIGICGAIWYASLCYMDWLLVGEIALGSVIGVAVGARIMPRVPARALKRAFGGLMVVVAILLFIGVPL